MPELEETVRLKEYTGVSWEGMQNCIENQCLNRDSKKMHLNKQKIIRLR
jgi:hypothetical protein